jgi:hypothetical protein
MSLLSEDDPIIRDTLERMGVENPEPINIQYTPAPVYEQEEVEEPEYQEEEVERLPEDNEISEAELRLEKAALYKQFVSGDIFSGSGPIIDEVTQEFRDFARQQYLFLLGVKNKPILAQEIFTDQEIQVLKTLASKVLNSPKLLQPKENKVEKPKPTKLQPKVIQPEPEVVRQVVRKPTLMVRNAEEPTVQAKPKPIVSNTKPSTVKPPKNAKNTNVSTEKVPPNNEVIEENGKKVRVHHLPMANLDEYGPINGARVRKMSDGQSIFLKSSSPDQLGGILENNIQIYKTNGGIYKIIKTPIVDTEANKKIPGYIPFPDNGAFSAITTQTATNVAARIKNGIERRGY